MIPEQLSMFTGVLCHAWKIFFEFKAGSERGIQKYLPTTFWQWSFCVIKLGISAAEQSRISCWAVLWRSLKGLWWSKFSWPSCKTLGNWSWKFIFMCTCMHTISIGSDIFALLKRWLLHRYHRFGILFNIFYTYSFLKRKLSDYNVPKHPPSAES